jgi:hypothetical protein
LDIVDVIASAKGEWDDMILGQLDVRFPLPAEKASKSVTSLEFPPLGDGVKAGGFATTIVVDLLRLGMVGPPLLAIPSKVFSLLSATRCLVGP